MNFSRDEIIRRADILVEAMPYISKFSGKTIVIKYGGNAMNDAGITKTIMQDLATLKIVGVNPVLVHGGGPEINAYLDLLGIKSEFVGGMRVTTHEAMEIVQMVLCGKINKNLVSVINTLGVKAVGLCGKDGNLIEVEKLKSGKVDYGYVGEIKKINTALLTEVSKTYIPVIATIGVDAKGEAYNINADTAAGAIGGALNAEKLLYLTDIDGIRADEKDPASLISKITIKEIDEMTANGKISGGMIPKVKSCVDAIGMGVKSVQIINGTLAHSILLELFTDTGIGTMIMR
jgi:acetylglutamate kinase